MCLYAIESNWLFDLICGLTMYRFFSFFHRSSFRYASRCSVNLLFRDCASRSRYASFASFAHFAQRSHFASQRRCLVVIHDLNLSSNSWNFYTDLVVSKISQLMLFDSNLLNLMHSLCILRYFLAHFSNSWLFWLKLLFFDFISMTDLLFVFEFFVLNFWLQYLTKNWPIYQLQNRLFWNKIDFLDRLIEFVRDQTLNRIFTKNSSYVCNIRRCRSRCLREFKILRIWIVHFVQNLISRSSWWLWMNFRRFWWWFFRWLRRFRWFTWFTWFR